MSKSNGLVYTGGGFIPGIPARDLSADEVEAHGGEKKLISTGLYKKPAPAKKEPGKEGK